MPSTIRNYSESTRNESPRVVSVSLLMSETHYHICWSDSSLDWKPFPTKEDALELARLITKPNETFVIVERDHNCERCKEFKSQSTR